MYHISNHNRNVFWLLISIADGAAAICIKQKKLHLDSQAFEFCAAEKAISESAFHKCVTIDYPESVNALREGNCREIIEKNFKIGESDCTAKFLKPNMEFYSKDCQGPDRDAALIELDKILKSKNINK